MMILLILFAIAMIVKIGGFPKDLGKSAVSATLQRFIPDIAEGTN
jgi:hypothetical protein